MQKLRTPFFGVALLVMVVVVAVETGSTLFVVDSFAGMDFCANFPAEEKADCQQMDVAELQALQGDVTGLGIPYLALVDAALLFTVGLMGVSLLIPKSIHGRLQGVITLIFALLVLLACIGLIFVAIGKLLLMIGLLLSVPFGTIAYFAMYAFFAKGSAAAVLAALMTLKIVFIICLLFAHQRFIQNKGLVLIVITSLLATIIVSFLHGLVPRFLVSISDAVAAIVVGIIAAIWLLILLIGSLPSIVKAVA